MCVCDRSVWSLRQKSKALLYRQSPEPRTSQHSETSDINTHNGARESGFVGTDFDCKVKSRREIQTGDMIGKDSIKGRPNRGRQKDF